MLRLIALLLLLANMTYYAWSHDWLAAWGLGPVVHSETARLEQQHHPETLRLLPDPAAAAAATAAATPEPAPEPETNAAETTAPTAPSESTAAPATPTQCLQTGGLDERQAQALRHAAADLPPGSWVLEPTTLAERWMVYMGRFADAEALDKKRNELRALEISFDRPGATWEPGLSLGRFASEERAQVALAQLGRQGIRTARVVLERKATEVYTLRLPAVDAALQARLPGLKKTLAGKKLVPCE